VKYSKLDEPKAEGEYRGRRVKVFAYTIQKTGYDDEKIMTTFTRAEASHKAEVKNALRMQHEGIGAKLDKMMGAKDIIVGTNPGFDGKYMVECESESYAKAVLDAGVQGRMVEAGRYLRQAGIEKGAAYAQMIGHVGDKKFLGLLLDIAADLAEKAER
jgi:hypothetical protein